MTLAIQPYPRASQHAPRAAASLFAALAALASIAAVRPALAQNENATPDVARAESYAAEAFQAYAEKDYPRAVSLYEQALEAAPSADILYNIARIYDTKLEDPAHAEEYYQRYLESPDAEAGRVRTVTERLQRLRGVPPAAASPVSAPPPAAPPPAPRPVRPTGMTGTRIAGIVMGAVGVVAMGVGGALAFAAKADADTTHELCDGNMCISQRGVDAAHDAETKANFATGGIVGGGVLIAAGLTLFVLGAHSPEDEVAALRIVPAFGPGGLGTQLSGRF